MYCIYIIRNIVNGKFYIGSTKNFNQRTHRHKNDLRNNRHHSIYLQRSWNKHGEESFEFNIIMRKLTKDEAKKYEEYFINKYYENTYNVSKNFSGGDIITYHPNLESIKKKHSENGRKWWDSKTEEEKEEFANKFKGKNNAMYGKTHSEEARAKISNARKGKKMSEEQRLTCSKAQRKRYLDPEEKRKVSERNRIRYSDPKEREKTSLANKKRFEDPEERRKMSLLVKKRYEDPKEREKLSMIGKKRFENPQEREKISKIMRERYKKDYKVYTPNGETFHFFNKCDVFEYLNTNFGVGEWIFKKLIDTGEPYKAYFNKHKRFEGLRIEVNEIK